MNNILASNFKTDVTESVIRTLFVPFGAIERIKIMTDRKTAQPTGAVFIEMANDAEAQTAIAAVNGVEFNGRTLNAIAARPQLHRNSRGVPDLKGD
jgi:RNA recognition motif-containing protein